MKQNYLWWLQYYLHNRLFHLLNFGCMENMDFFFSKKDWFWEFHLKLELTTVYIFPWFIPYLTLPCVMHWITFNKQKQNVILIIAFQSYEDTWVEPIYLHTRWLNSLHFGMRNACIFVFKLQCKSMFFCLCWIQWYKLQNNKRAKYNATPTKS